MNSTDALQTVHSGPVAGLEATSTCRSTLRLSQPDRHRHGRHQLRHRPGHGRRREVLRLQPGHRPLAGQHADDAPAHARRRRRLDRTLRPLWNAIEVGPQSAGSDPGPACYGRGGTQPTITDANLVLGYLDEKNYAGGRIKLKPAARRARDRGARRRARRLEPDRGGEGDQAQGRRATWPTRIFKEVRGQGLRPEELHAAGLRRRRSAARLRLSPARSASTGS